MKQVKEFNHAGNAPQYTQVRDGIWKVGKATFKVIPTQHPKTFEIKLAPGIFYPNRTKLE